MRRFVIAAFAMSVSLSLRPASMAMRSGASEISECVATRWNPIENLFAP